MLLSLLCGCTAPAQTPAPAAPSQADTVETAPDAAPAAEFDLDLTELNDTMRYAQVLLMQAEPEEYIGKTVKVEGYFYIYEGDIRNVYVCLVPDSTACCTAGLEFRLAGEHKFPDDYPPVGTPLTVGGIFETYPEGDKYYCRLKEAEVVFGT